MRETKVAIVGGGVAGLACLQELSDKGVSTVLFESSSEVGGRVKTFRCPNGSHVELGAGYICGYYKSTLDLIERFNLGEFLEKRDKSKVKFFTREYSIENNIQSIIFNLLKRDFYFRDLLSRLYVKKLSKYVASSVYNSMNCNEINGSDFIPSSLGSLDEAVLEVDQIDTASTFLLLKELAKLIFFSKSYNVQSYPSVPSLITENIFSMIESVSRKQLHQTAHNAKLSTLLLLFSCISGDTFVLRKGLQQLPRRFFERYSDKIYLQTQITRAESEFGRWSLQSLEKKKAVFSHLVMATPMPVTSQILGYDLGVKYFPARVLVVNGRLRKNMRHLEKMFIFNQSNDLYGITRYNNDIYKLGVGKSFNMDDYFDHYHILKDHSWKNAIVSSSPHKMKNMHLQDNIYFAGDSHLSCIEFSIFNGKRAAQNIIKRLEEE